jgi:hypothetical protein
MSLLDFLLSESDILNFSVFDLIVWEHFIEIDTASCKRLETTLKKLTSGG